MLRVGRFEDDGYFCTIEVTATSTVTLDTLTEKHAEQENMTLPELGLDSPLARGLMIVIWSLALLGILFKLTIAHRFKILSLVTYLAMGWLSLVVIYEMAVKLAAGSVTLLAVGGVVYSLGVIFYVCKRIPYNHAIWHGFVLGGSVCHFLAIYLYIGQA